MRRYTLLVTSALTILFVGLAPQTAVSQKAQKISGMVTGTQKVVSSFDLPSGGSLRRIFFELSVTANSPSNPFHLGNETCFAAYEFTASDSLVQGHGSCNLISPEGDIYWFTVEASGTEIQWKGIGGTGKFVGLEASGTAEVRADWPDGKHMAEWEGTMTKK